MDELNSDTTRLDPVTAAMGRIKVLTTANPRSGRTSTAETSCDDKSYCIGATHNFKDYRIMCSRTEYRYMGKVSGPAAMAKYRLERSPCDLEGIFNDFKQLRTSLRSQGKLLY